MNFVMQELPNKLYLNEQSVNISIFDVLQNTIQAKIMINVRIKFRFNSFSENLQCSLIKNHLTIASKIHTET